MVKNIYLKSYLKQWPGLVNQRANKRAAYVELGQPVDPFFILGPASRATHFSSLVRYK